MAMKVGIFVDSLLLPIAEGLAKAAEWGADCFQVYITGGEMLAENMSGADRAEFVSRYKDLGLELSATCGDFHLDFADAELMAEKEAVLLAALDQTVELGASVMTTHIGSVGDDPDASRERTMIATLKRLGDAADQRGVVMATETGSEPGPRLREILDRSDTKGIGVNFDPANLVMRGFDHFEAVRALAGCIVHSHAKDGKRGGGEVPSGPATWTFPHTSS